MWPTHSVIHHLIHRHRQRGCFALQHIAERIANEDHIHAATVFQRGKAGVVSREHGDFFTLVFHSQQLGQGDGFVRGEISHGDLKIK
jgi:transcription elongation factor